MERKRPAQIRWLPDHRPRPEALTTIDVRTGAYVGSRNLEETIFKTNLEAAQGIAKLQVTTAHGGIVISIYFAHDRAGAYARCYVPSRKRSRHARTSIC